MSAITIEEFINLERTSLHARRCFLYEKINSPQPLKKEARDDFNHSITLESVEECSNHKYHDLHIKEFKLEYITKNNVSKIWYLRTSEGWITYQPSEINLHIIKKSLMKY